MNELTLLNGTHTQLIRYENVSETAKNSKSSKYRIEQKVNVT